jgi:FAD/FMN-containing dehydrogenase
MLASKEFLFGSLLAAVVSAKNFSSITVATLSDGASCACTKLTSLYPDLVLGTNSTNYTTEAINYWDVRADLEPMCIFMPTKDCQVASAVSIFTTCGTQVAVRGGGHMNLPGSNNINGGVLLAFNNMAETVVASDNTTIAVGPGARWVDVYEALSSYGLYCIGGRLKVIGVSGLELIGGFHYLINAYGFAMDNVLSYDVVLGNSSQVVANSTSNPDLFWALKGGANNFGIVTKYTIKALPIPLISTTIQSFAESEVPAFVKATADLAANDGPELAAGSIISISYNLTTGVVTPQLLGVQEGSDAPPSRFTNFTAIPNVFNTSNVMRPIDWHSQLDSPNQMFRYIS